MFGGLPRSGTPQFDDTKMDFLSLTEMVALSECKSFRIKRMKLPCDRTVEIWEEVIRVVDAGPEAVPRPILSTTTEFPDALVLVNIW